MRRQNHEKRADVLFISSIRYALDCLKAMVRITMNNRLEAV